MTEYSTIRKVKVYEKESIPTDAEIIHTEALGGTGPLLVWYIDPEDQ